MVLLSSSSHPSTFVIPENRTKPKAFPALSRLNGTKASSIHPKCWKACHKRLLEQSEGRLDTKKVIAFLNLSSLLASRTS
ncbi:hypothetical protein HanRHA438_Chr06g0282711 [Helianthus annuus]|nr:hypothetical protein HanRHA438_Chr06g0282711 [Helianthus annuus]